MNKLMNEFSWTVFIFVFAFSHKPNRFLELNIKKNQITTKYFMYNIRKTTLNKTVRNRMTKKKFIGYTAAHSDYVHI